MTQTASARLDRMRLVASIAAAVGAVGSTGLMLVSGQHPPLSIVLLFVIWNVAPFAVLLWGTLASARWPAAARSALYGTTVVVTAASLVLFAYRVAYPPKSTAAFMFVAVPIGSWLLMASVFIAALISGKLSQRPAR